MNAKGIILIAIALIMISSSGLSAFAYGPPTTQTNGCPPSSLCAGITQTANFSCPSRALYPCAFETNTTEYPPGLGIGWASSNMSVNAFQVTQTIFLSQSQNLSVSQVASNGEIASVAYNQTALQFRFVQNGTVSLSFASTKPPVAIYADAKSVPFSYVNGVVTVTADPTTMTVLYAPPSSPFNNTMVLILLGAAAAISLILVIIVERRK